MAKKVSAAIPDKLPTVRVAMHAPGLHEPELMVTFGVKCLAGGTANPTTIGTSPYLPPIQAEVTAVNALVAPAAGGATTSKTNLRAGTSKLFGAIKAHASWVGIQILPMAAAEAQAYVIAAGFTPAKIGTHPATDLEVTQGKPGSGIIHASFDNPPGRVMGFVEYMLPGTTAWIRGEDTDLSHIDLPPLTPGETIQVRLRLFIHGEGYTPWTLFSIIVI
jgi:hypothetical protein